MPQPLAESLCEPRLPVAGVECEGSVVPEGTPLAVPDMLELGVSDGLWLPERDAAGEEEGGCAVCEGAEPLGGAEGVGDPEGELEAEAHALPLRDGAHVRLTDALGLLNGERDALPLEEAQVEPVPDAHGEGLALALPVPRREKVGVPEVVSESKGERDAEALGAAERVPGEERLPEGLGDADEQMEIDMEGEGVPLAVSERNVECVDEAQPEAVRDAEGKGLAEPLRGEEGVGGGLPDALPQLDTLAQGDTVCVVDQLPQGVALPQADLLNDALPLRRLEVVPLRVCEGDGEVLVDAADDKEPTGEALPLALQTCESEDEAQGVAPAEWEGQAEVLVEEVAEALIDRHMVELNEEGGDAVNDTVGEIERDNMGDFELCKENEVVALVVCDADGGGDMVEARLPEGLAVEEVEGCVVVEIDADIETPAVAV